MPKVGESNHPTDNRQNSIGKRLKLYYPVGETPAKEHMASSRTQGKDGMMKELKVGERVIINENYNWSDNEHIVIDINEEIVVYDASGSSYSLWHGQGSDYSFIRDNLQVVSKEPTNQSPVDTLHRIQTFTKKHKNLEISFEDGKMILRDWDIRLSEPMDYLCDTFEQLEELMGAWDIVKKFNVEIE